MLESLFLVLSWSHIWSNVWVVQWKPHLQSWLKKTTPLIHLKPNHSLSLKDAPARDTSTEDKDEKILKKIKKAERDLQAAQGQVGVDHGSGSQSGLSEAC